MTRLARNKKQQNRKNIFGKNLIYSGGKKKVHLEWVSFEHSWVVNLFIDISLAIFPLIFLWQLPVNISLTASRAYFFGSFPLIFLWQLPVNMLRMSGRQSSSVYLNHKSSNKEKNRNKILNIFLFPFQVQSPFQEYFFCRFPQIFLSLPAYR